MSGSGSIFTRLTSDGYDRFMGRYSRELAPLVADHAGVVAPMAVLDVGCGPGALTAELVKRLGAKAVSACDPSPVFIESVTANFPGATVKIGAIEALPFPDNAFDAALAQLVLHFVVDPVKGVSEMMRVTRPGGTVAATVWNNDDEALELVRVFDAAAPTIESDQPYKPMKPKFGSAASVVALFQQAGLQDVDARPLKVASTYANFGEYWEIVQHAQGPIGEFVSKLSDVEMDRLKDALAAELNHPTGAFTLTGVASSVIGRVPA